MRGKATSDAQIAQYTRFRQRGLRQFEARRIVQISRQTAARIERSPQFKEALAKGLPAPERFAPTLTKQQMTPQQQYEAEVEAEKAQRRVDPTYESALARKLQLDQEMAEVEERIQKGPDAPEPLDEHLQELLKVTPMPPGHPAGRSESWVEGSGRSIAPPAMSESERRWMGPLTPPEERLRPGSRAWNKRAAERRAGGRERPSPFMFQGR